MKKHIFSLVISILAMAFSSCSSGQVQGNKTELTPPEFSAKIAQVPSATIVDVRTPGEYSKGHLENSKNIDWNGADFEKQVNGFDKSKPIFVYCLSGGRSASAASLMRSIGFKEVYELEGGMNRWRNEGLPETQNAQIKSKGMTKLQFDSLLISDKLVLIDFYAEWCGPCKKMTPYLEELKIERKDNLIIFRLDADENQTLMRELHVSGLPFLMLYKNKKLIWSNSGYISKEDLTKQLK